MYFWVLAILSVSALAAADSQQLALAVRAQSDFDRVELAVTPLVGDTSACVQSQAAELAVAAPSEVPMLHYRKGYCALAGATVTRNQAGFREAAGYFDQAIETWPARLRTGSAFPPEPVPAGLRVLASVARLWVSQDDVTLERARNEIFAALTSPVCPANLMPPAFCQSVLETGKQWYGWMALRGSNFDVASRYLSGAGATGWSAWVSGRRAFQSRDYAGAAAQYKRAVDAWNEAGQKAAPTLTERLNPRPDWGETLTEFAEAKLLAGDAAGAIATLDEAVQRNPSIARAFYLRARARELAGQKEQALADYNLASRTAFANARELASGEAHLYRGILLYRRNDFARAEDEFSSALNFEIPAFLRSDAIAWRHLAAVAGGSCGASRERLEQSMWAASPYFPAEEARTRLASCPTSVSAAIPGSIAVK